MQPSRLSLRGVPLELADLSAEQDVFSDAFVSSQAAFDAERGEGTPLLPPGRTSPEFTGPSPYVRVAVTAMLVRMAAGGDGRPQGEDEQRAAVEPHTALIEALSDVASRSAGAAPSAPLAAEPSKPFRAGVKLSDRPSWLMDAVVKGLVRADESAQPPGPPSQDGLPPVLRLSSESAYWRGIPAHGARDRQIAEAAASALSVASRAPALAVPDWPAPSSPELPRAEEWLPTSRARMAGSLVNSKGMPPRPGDDFLRGAALRLLAGDHAQEDASGSAAVLDEASVRSFLSNSDVMRNYVFQPM